MFRGKVVSKREVETPIGKATITTKDYPSFPKRTQIIFWLGEQKVVKLGEFITVYHVKKRQSITEPVKYIPLYYRVTFTNEADVNDTLEYYISDIEKKDVLSEGLEFDDKDSAEEFAHKMKCKHVTQGGVFIGSKTEFERWKKVMETIK